MWVPSGRLASGPLKFFDSVMDVGGPGISCHPSSKIRFACFVHGFQTSPIASDLKMYAKEL